MILVLGIAAIIVSLWDKFSESRYRPLRAGVFVAMGCSGIIPAIHFTYTDGMRQLIDENGFYWLLTMAFFYLTGATLYATRVPERFWPGKCDLLVS
jgi:adiponectin receptor